MPLVYPNKEDNNNNKEFEGIVVVAIEDIVNNEIFCDYMYDLTNTQDLPAWYTPIFDT